MTRICHRPQAVSHHGAALFRCEVWYGAVAESDGIVQLRIVKRFLAVSDEKRRFVAFGAERQIHLSGLLRRRKEQRVARSTYAPYVDGVYGYGRTGAFVVKPCQWYA